MSEDKTLRLNRADRQTEVRETQKRVPAGQPKVSLIVKGIPKGYRGYWAREEQIQELLDAGYEFVAQENVQVGSEQDRGDGLGNVVQHQGKRGTRLYLMKIKQEWYDENQALKQKEVDAVDHQIHKGLYQTHSHNYVVKGGVTVEDTTADKS